MLQNFKTILCSLILLNYSLVFANESSSETLQENVLGVPAGATLQPPSVDKLSFLDTKINSCSPDQVIIEVKGSRIIATKINKFWKLEVINISDDPKQTIPKTESAMVQARNHVYAVSKSCHNQADVDHINKSLKSLKAESLARSAKLPTVDKISDSGKKFETGR